MGNDDSIYVNTETYYQMMVPYECLDEWMAWNPMVSIKVYEIVDGER